MKNTECHVPRTNLFAWMIVALVLTAAAGTLQPVMERIVVAPEGKGFTTAQSRHRFVPWGMNYGNAGRLLEDFWDKEWPTLAGDFRELKELGANVVRVHLQFGKLMVAQDQTNPAALKQLRRLLKLAEETRLYLDITGLGCYRPADTPAWYDALGEKARWTAQANFWSAVAETCKDSPAVFCYDLINEPISPAGKREAGQWRSGSLFGEYDFLQYIALEPAGRTREAIARAWIERMTRAIRKHDCSALITVGLLPWSRQWKHLSGFLPETVGPKLDFLSVHIYPDPKKPGEEMECLRQFAVGKPVVIEETFPLSCSAAELESFLRASRPFACGWLGHCDGHPIAELEALQKSGKLTIPQSIYLAWEQLFVRLKPEFTQ
ncbi:MAG: cellulase family glycosylhydrolase [Limisphaerales bacterium]